MGGGLSCETSKRKQVEVLKEEDETETEVEDEEDEDEEFYAETEEEAEEIRERMAKYKKLKDKRIHSKELMKRRKREASGDQKATKMLEEQLKDMIRTKQLTTEYQKGRFGTEDFNKNRFYLPNRKFDRDDISVKDITLSRRNDLNRPEPISIHCTFDWTNGVQKVMGTAHERYEAIWHQDFWEIRNVS
jgi:hypothetical protein